MKIRNKTLRFIEFFLVGVIMGVAEDILAVSLSTGERITFKVIWIVFLVALPFAIISEYVVDHPRFWKTILRLKDENEVEKRQNSS
ncbi:MAG: hypothetical protein HY378_01385 [Candidatus Brennerbacteria bacterium]|nr:hypothetical protein [Candidatus Brennerbacteria bacterium]